MRTQYSLILMPTRVTDLADPHRCKAVMPNGQCTNTAENGFEYCGSHRKQSGKIVAPDLKQYALTNIETAARIAHFSTSERAKSANEEVGAIKWLLEKYINLCKSESDILAYGGMIERLQKRSLESIKTLVELEEKTQTVLTVSQLVPIFNYLATIVHEEICHVDGFEDIEDKINRRIVDMLKNKKPPSNPN